MALGKILKKMIRAIVPPKAVYVTVEQVAPSELLKNQNIIITGGGRGLGFYIAKKAVQEGAKVVITGRNEETLKRAANELGESCRFLVSDVTDFENYGVMFRKASELVEGKIHSLVSNAGVSFHEGSFRNVTLDGWDKQMDTNLKGNYFLVKSYIEYLEQLEDKRSSIVIVTSERGKRSDDIPYGLTKCATNSFLQGIASKVIHEGIRINGVGPGVTASEMTGYDKNGDLYADWQPGERVFVPEEVAEVVVFLLSNVSNCINGEIITCDHGRYISHW